MSTDLTFQPNSRQSNMLRPGAASVLIVDDEPGTRIRLELALPSHEDLAGTRLICASRIQEALDLLAETSVQVVILDKHLEFAKSSENGIDAIPHMLSLQPHLQILVLTGSHEIPDVVRAMKLGAFNYITKETPDELLLSHIDRALHVAKLKQEKERRERADTPDLLPLGGHSRIFRKVLQLAEMVSSSDRPVLLLGETGTGKTELAKWIHKKRASLLGQKDPPFFAVNVSSLARNLIESEVFGHEKGSFTSASQMKRGLFELAQNGTLFLDEIGEFPLDLQATLLTVIEEGTFMRVGGTQVIKSHPKLILATHRNLKEMVLEGKFRRDLYMRISSFPVQMPSLIERREDIPEIVKALLPKVCQENRIQIGYDDLPENFIAFLMNTSIEGNIRGIQHLLERLLVFSPKDRNGRPVFTRWEVLFDQPTLNDNTSERESHGPISYTELKSRPWNFIEGEFPGMNEMLEEIRLGLLDEVSDKFENRRQSAKALGFMESSFSMLLRRYPDIEKKFNLRGNRRGTRGSLGREKKRLPVME